MVLNDGLRMKGVVRGWFRDAKTGEVVDYFEHHNLITDAGKAAVAARLVGDTAVANRGEVTFGAVGLDDTTPAPGNTIMGNELFRKLLTLRSFAANVATFQVFFNTSEANGLLKEFALFGEDATAAADSGTMFNHVNIDKVKTVAITLTIEAQITIG